MNGPETTLHATDESHKDGGSGYSLRWESPLEAVRRSLASGKRYPASLAIETAAVAVGSIVAIRFLNVQSALSFKWLIIPCLLVSAALLPTWLRRGDFPPVWRDGKHAAASLVVVSVTCLCAIPAVFLGLWLMARMQWSIPLRPAVAGPGGWLTWLVYQFFYVAVAEEVFFRGYIQANVMKLIGEARPNWGPTGSYIAIVVSAGCFALAHVVVQGQITPLLTFLPGLIMAWLFTRTQSLLAPILFHGLANVSYGVIALSLM
jgi:membrane protease YdiL (CAAX protease family)